MKKQNLLKLAFTMLAMVIMTGAMAQNPASILTNYVEQDETIYQTEGFNLTLIALPDLALSPDYDAATNTGYNSTSEWQWMSGSWGGDLVQAWDTDNTVEIPAPAAEATVTYFVKERFGNVGCESVDAEEKTVAGVAEPDITAFTAVNNGGWTYNAVDDIYEICSATASDAIDITIEELGSSVAMQSYTYGITVTRTEYDGNMVPQGTTDQTGVWGQTADLDGMVAGQSPTFTITDMVILNDGSTDVPTQYDFTFTPNSLASTTTRVSDFRAGGDGTNAFFNNFTADVTVSYILYPTPVTGPIYHIPNDFSGY
jgi:hypothetical protein